MIKKITLILNILLVSSIALAEVELSPSIQRARKYRAELVQKQDEMLELLLQVPFEQRQYIFPMLSANQSVPKKIKTHPEVLVWKGKKPTRIANRFKNDKELIEYLPEQFYYFLAPEAWPDQPEQNQVEINPNQILQNLTRSENTELSVMPEELLDIYGGLNILQELVKKQTKHPPMPLYFEKWIASVPQNVQKEIEEKTGLSGTEFALRTDNITKAYRTYQNQKIPPISPEQQLVKEYWSLIPFIFTKTGFRDTLNPTFYRD